MIKRLASITMVSRTALIISLLGSSAMQSTDFPEEKNVSRHSNFNDKSTDKEKGGEETLMPPLEDTMPIYPRVQCLWHINTLASQQAALELLDQAARSGDARASVKFLKKLGKLGTLETLLRDNRDFLKGLLLADETFPGPGLKEKENDAQLMELERTHDDPFLLVENLKAGFVAKVDDFYNQSKFPITGSCGDRFKFLRLSFYHQRLLGEVEGLKQLQKEIVNLMQNPDLTHLLHLKLHFLEYQVGLIESTKAEELKEAFLEFLGFGQDEKFSIYKGNAPKKERTALKRLTAKIYRKFGDENFACLLKDSSHKQDYYKKAAGLGDVTAEYRLGLLYEDGSLGKANPTLAGRSFFNASKNGYAPAQHKRALTAEQKDPTNQKDVLAWLRRAAVQGHPDSQYRLFLDLRGQKGKLREMHIFLRGAAEGGHLQAQQTLAGLYWHGRHYPQDYSKALVWYKKAAAQGHWQAWYYVGLAAEKGFGRERDDTEAINAYRSANMIGRVAFLEKGEDILAAVKLRIGRMYEKGKGIEMNKTLALKEYIEAAELGNPEAAYYAGRLYLRGWNLTSPDLKRAHALLTQACDSSLPKAMFQMAVMRQFGWGTEQSYEDAAHWYMKAAEHKNKDGGVKVESLYQLAWMHKRGLIDGTKSPEKSYGFLKLAANLRHERSLYRAGKMALRLNMFEEAHSILRHPSLASDPNALYHLGRIYEGYKRQDELFIKAAKECYLKAAEKRHVWAAYRIAKIYKEEKNKDKAIQYFEQAAEYSHRPSLKTLVKIYKEDKSIEGGLAKRKAYLSKTKPGVNFGYINNLVTLIEDGDVNSLNELENLASQKEGSPQKCIQKAYAQKHLGWLWIENKYVPHQNLSQGIQLYKQSYQNGMLSMLRQIEDLADLGVEEAKKVKEQLSKENEVATN